MDKSLLTDRARVVMSGGLLIDAFPVKIHGEVEAEIDRLTSLDAEASEKAKKRAKVRKAKKGAKAKSEAPDAS